jgi:hypothetical protein
LSACPPTATPIWASSPTAWIAVVTSSGPLGGPERRRVGSSGGGVTGRGRCGGCVGAALTRGLAAFGFAVAGFAVAGFAAAGFAAAGFAAFGFAAAGFAALALVGFAAFGFATAGFAVLALASPLAGRRRPIGSGRVAGRLPSTLDSALLDFFDFFGLRLFSDTAGYVEGAGSPQYSHRAGRARRFVESRKYRA